MNCLYEACGLYFWLNPLARLPFGICITACDVNRLFDSFRDSFVVFCSVLICDSLADYALVTCRQ